MVKLQDILLEKYGDKPDRENPNKILVRNKESGKTYYISRDSYDPSKHDKSVATKKKSKPDVKTKSRSSKKSSGSGKTSKSSNYKDAKKKSTDTSAPDSSDPIAAAFGKIDKKREKDKEETGKASAGDKKEKDLTPAQKLEQKLGSYVFIDGKQRDEIFKTVSQIRPDLQKKLLGLEFTPLFSRYGDLVDVHDTQITVGDKDGAAETLSSIKKSAKRMQAISIAKFAVISNPTQNDNTTKSARYYHASSDSVNDVLRGLDFSGGKTILTNSEIMKIRKEIRIARERGLPIKQKYSSDALRAMEVINNLDSHFSSEGAVLMHNVTVFRGIDPSIIDKFVDAGEWIDNGYTSTSLNPLTAENFMIDEKEIDGNTVQYVKQERPVLLRINLKRGMRVLTLPCNEDEFCVQTEITLPRGCRFRFTSHDKKTNVYNVELEQPSEHR